MGRASGVFWWRCGGDPIFITSKAFELSFSQLSQHVNHFDEHFDLDWLLERHQNRSIGVDDIRRYKIRMRDDLPAPADAEAVQKWMDDEDSILMVCKCTSLH